MLIITKNLKIPLDQIDLSAVRAQGSGGQNVNKVSTAIHLRFDIQASTLPIFYKEKLLALKDRRISKDGIVIIKAQKFRSQEKNRNDALDRLKELIKKILITPKKRKPTKPTKGSKIKRLDHKTKRGQLKKQRSNPFDQ